jgi:hypothetical protein
VHPLAYLTVGTNVAAYASDSTRYGVDAAFEYMGAALKGEYIGQHRVGGGLDDKGWYAQARCRVLPWCSSSPNRRTSAVRRSARRCGTGRAPAG